MTGSPGQDMNTCEYTNSMTLGQENSSHHTDIHSTCMHFCPVFDQFYDKLTHFQIYRYLPRLDFSPHQFILSTQSEITWNRLTAFPSTHILHEITTSKSLWERHTDDLTLQMQRQYITVDLWYWMELWHRRWGNIRTS